MYWGNFRTSKARGTYSCYYSNCDELIAAGEFHLVLSPKTKTGKRYYKKFHFKCIEPYIVIASERRRAAISKKLSEQRKGRPQSLQMPPEVKAERHKLQRYVFASKKQLEKAYADGSKARIFKAKNTLARHLRELYETENLGPVRKFQLPEDTMVYIAQGKDDYLSITDYLDAQSDPLKIATLLEAEQKIKAGREVGTNHGSPSIEPPNGETIKGSREDVGGGSN